MINYTSWLLQLVLNTVSGCSDGVLAAFHKHCVQAMVQEQVKGLGVVGYKLFIQVSTIDKWRNM